MNRKLVLVPTTILAAIAIATPASAESEGQLRIEGYRQILGNDGRFFRFAEKLADRYAYSTIKTGQFIRQAKRHSRLEGADLRRLERYFRQWLYGETKPTLTPADFE